jgi:pimeloyl-ACP methyl ester carboxylesterase
MAFYQLHPNTQINFSFNRLLTYGEQAGRLEEIKEIAYRFHDFNSWFVEWTALAQKCEREGRFMHAAYAYRMAEFLMKDGHVQKEVCFSKFRENFYKSFEEGEIERHEVPYLNSSLPVIKIKANPEKAVILVHGGYDSFMEEFYLTVRDFAGKFGYTVVMFEGPGQGQALRNGFKMTHEWEKPVKAILDHFKLNDVTILGISLGGYLAPRAAAFEPRITRVISHNICYDFMDGLIRWMPPVLNRIFRVLFRLRAKWAINRLIGALMKRNMGIKWLVEHGMYIIGAKTPFEYYDLLSKYTVKDIAPLVKQDVLLLAGEKDHFMPIEHYPKMKDALINARSVKGRVFTEAEGGEQHCQLGNHYLAIEEIVRWLDGFYARKS